MTNVDTHLSQLREYVSETVLQLRLQHKRLRETPQPISNPSDLSQERAGNGGELPEGIKTAIITFNEVNAQHGTGLLVKRLFPDDSAIVHLRSTYCYGGNSFGACEILIPPALTTSDYYRSLVGWFGAAEIEHVICVPFTDADLEAAMVVSEICRAPLGIYIMDDQNLSGEQISDEVLSRALSRASVRFAISEEMRRAYENKFGFKFYFLPPVVEDQWICRIPSAGTPANSPRGIMLGNIWEPAWLDALRHCTREAGVEIDWYGNANGLSQFDQTELAADGIHFQGVSNDSDLATIMKKYAFGIIASEPAPWKSGHWLARFSLPTRLITCLATGNLPLVVIGSADSASAAFVRRFDLGIVTPYSGETLKASIREILAPERQEKIRRRAAELASTFSNKGIQEWLIEAVREGYPPSNRFESLPPSGEATLIPWIEPDPPSWVAHYDVEIWRMLELIKRLGRKFEFFIDVGASNGTFSYLASRVLELTPEKTRLILVEPQIEAYRQLNPWYFDQLPLAECFPIALGNESGEMTLHVTPELFDSSVFTTLIAFDSKPLKVPVKTLEELAGEIGLEGRGILKVDVQGAEDLVIEGAGQFLDQIDLVMLETNLDPPDPSIRDFAEIIAMMKERGFRFFDHSGGWRDPYTGVSRQLDVWFIRDDTDWPMIAGNHIPDTTNS